MQQVGRNNLCPCGSGKKYKYCCLNQKQESKAAAGQQQKYVQAKSSVLMKLGDLMLSQEYKTDLLRAENVYFALKESKEEISDLEKLGFYSWFTQDYILEDNCYFIEDFCKERIKYLDEIEQFVAKELRAVSQKIYEIKDIKKDKGLLLKEIYECKEVFIHDSATANGAVIGDLIAIRVIPVGEEHHPVGIGTYISASYKEEIYYWIEEEYRKYRQISKHATYTEFMRRYSLRFSYFFERITQRNNTKQEQQSFFIHEDEVIQLIQENMKRPYREEDLEKSCNLWVIYKAERGDLKGKAQGFAAGLEYIISKQQKYGFSQAQIGEKYDVSASTVGKRYKEMIEVLER